MIINIQLLKAFYFEIQEPDCIINKPNFNDFVTSMQLYQYFKNKKETEDSLKSLIYEIENNIAKKQTKLLKLELKKESKINKKRDHFGYIKRKNRW